MTAAGPWSVKGIDPKAREIAKDLARRSGMTLGEWLNQMIIEGGEPEPPPFEVPQSNASPAETRRRGLDDLYREARSPRSAPPLRNPDPPFADVRSTAPAHSHTAHSHPGPAHTGPEFARVAQALSDLSLRMEAAEHRSTLAISGIDQSVMGVLTRLDDLERDQGAGHARLDSSVAEVRATQAQVADRLRRLEHEDSGRVEALKALESALGRIVGQMQQGEAASDRSRQTLDALSRRMEQAEASSIQAATAFANADKVETVLSRMAERLDEAETRTSAAVQSLQSAFAGLDARLRQGEARHSGPSGAEIERRFQSLAEELSQRVEASRNELAQRLRSAADGRLDRLETTLREMRSQVDQAEQHSAQAIERIGREVMRVAKGLGERVAAAETHGHARAAQAEARIAAVESRSAAAVETLGGEVARIADVMETRLRQADGVQAQAMEKLGGEIARIAERLADRISSSDRRSAEAIDEVSDKVAKISERMGEQQTRSVSELADRIRQSEERTAKLLEEARERLDQRLGGRIPAPAAEAPPSPPIATPASVARASVDWTPPSHAAAPASPASNADPFGGLAAVAPPPIAPPPVAPAAPVVQPVAPTLAPAPDFAADDFALDNDPFAHRSALASELSPFDPDDDFAPAPVLAVVPTPAASLAPPPLAVATSPASFLSAPPPPQAEAVPPAATVFGHAPAATIETAAPEFMGFSVRDFAPAPEVSGGQMSTREMLEAARQAAKRAAGVRSDAPEGAVPAPPLDAARAPRPFGLTLPGRRKKESAPTLRTLALAALTAGAATTAVLGAHKLGSAASAGLDGGDAHAFDHADLATAAPTAAPPATAASTSPSTSTPSLAVALTSIAVPDSPPAKARPTAKAPAAATSATVKPMAKAQPTAKSAHARYADAVERIEGGDLAGVANLKAAADGGDMDAQFYLARLYEAGGAGLPKDLTQARRWTQKAAEGGDALAMYNYASYAYAGDGGPKDVAGAVTWFRRAAEHGVVNGQYNLAQLYEKGYGVPQDPAEAYKWYLAAARSGDAGAKAAAIALKSKLAPDALARAEKAAAVLHAQADDTAKTAEAAPHP